MVEIDRGCDCGKMPYKGCVGGGGDEFLVIGDGCPVCIVSVVENGMISISEMSLNVRD